MIRTILVVTCSFAIPLTLVAGDVGKLREIPAKGVKVEFKKGRWNKPTIVTSAEEFDKALPGADAVKKQVDFGIEKLLVFAWGGSGGDQLTAKMSDDGKTAMFTYKGGLTRDYRPHIHLFAVPKMAEVKLVGAK